MTEDCNQDGCGNGGPETLTLSRSSVTASVTLRVCGSDTVDYLLLFIAEIILYKIHNNGVLRIGKGVWPCLWHA